MEVPRKEKWTSTHMYKVYHFSLQCDLNRLSERKKCRNEDKTSSKHISFVILHQVISLPKLGGLATVREEGCVECIWFGSTRLP